MCFVLLLFFFVFFFLFFFPLHAPVLCVHPIACVGGHYSRDLDLPLPSSRLLHQLPSVPTAARDCLWPPQQDRCEAQQEYRGMSAETVL